MTTCDACNEPIASEPLKAERDGQVFRFCRECDGYKTLRVPTADWVIAQGQRKQAGRTWGEQIIRPENDERVIEGYGDMNNGVFLVRDGEFSRLEELVSQVPERTAEELEERFR